MICSGHGSIQYHNSNYYKKDGAAIAPSPIISNNTSCTSKSIVLPYEIITRCSTVQEQIAASLLLLADSTMSSEVGNNEEEEQVSTSNSVSGSGDTGFPGSEPASEHALAKATQAAITSRVIGQEGTSSRKRLRTEAEAKPKSDAIALESQTSSSDDGPAEEGPKSVVNVPLFDNHMQFPDQLWELLKYPGELQDAIWWMPGNDAFAINETVFSEKLLESHFRGNKFTSIIRKLNRWGFRKYVDRSLPPKTVAYYHRSFQKDRPELIKLIEKEEGKMEQPVSGGAPASQFCLFPEATTSQRIAHILQPSTPMTVRNMLGAVPEGASSSQSAMSLVSRFGAGPSGPGASVSLDRLAALTSPLNARSHSTILQSIFGQRVATNNNATSTSTSITSLAAAVAAASSSTNVAPVAAGLAAASGTNPARQAWHRTPNLHHLSQLHHQQQQRPPQPPQQHANTESMEQQALLRSMVNNIERERQQQRQQWQDEGRLLLALERERSRVLIQEQKQELDLPLSDADASLFSLMTTAQRESYLGIHHYNQQQQQLQQHEHTNRLLAAAAARRQGEPSSLGSTLLGAREQRDQEQLRQRAELTSQMQLRRQLQAAIASPNPFATPLSSQMGLGRRVLGQDSLALPAELLLSPQQRLQTEVLQFRERRAEDQTQNSRSSSNLPPPGNTYGP